jgi:hypothetical protein
MKTILTAVTLAVAVPAWAAGSPNPPPLFNVTVTNTPLPVTVTNPTHKQNVTVTNDSSSPLTVTNSASNPLNTVDAFTRTPVRFHQDGLTTPNLGAYVVPSGFNFVIETVVSEARCPPGFKAIGDLRIDLGNGTDVFPLPLMFQPVALTTTAPTDVDVYNASLSARVVMKQGEKLYSQCNCISSNKGVVDVWVYGYLVSVNSPSLAP